MRKAKSIEKVATPAPDVTVEEARRMLSYDPITGLLVWRVERYRKHAGDVAGCVHTCKNGYKRVLISINYKRYLAHRVIWLIVTGMWPEDEIDHRDSDATNNKWANLREATHLENGRNLKLKKNNNTGVAGVSWCGRRKLYRVRVTVACKELFLGYFETVELAKVVRDRAVLKHHGEFGKIL